MRLPRMWVPIGAAGLLVLAGPWVGQVRSGIRQAIPTSFERLANAVLLAIVALVIASAWRAWRRATTGSRLALGTAVMLAVTWALVTSATSAEQNAVERYHFLEYGAITFLFYRAWHTRGPTADPSSVLVPAISALSVAVADEAFQWFVPGRYGEWRDIFINLGAVSAGLLASVGLIPPAHWRWRTATSTRRLVCRHAALFVALLTAFTDLVHVGHVVVDSRVGSFRSRYSAAELMALSAERTARWSTRPPPRHLVRWSREDQYLTEGTWHIQQRNADWSAGAYGRAWHENLLLETYFAPVLDTASFLAPVSRWPPAQRADAASRVDVRAGEPFESHAERVPIVAWSQTTLWLVSAGAIALLLMLA